MPKASPRTVSPALAAGILGATLAATSLGPTTAAASAQESPGMATRAALWRPLGGPFETVQIDDAPGSPLRAAAASALVPGAGQWMHGQRRAWAYLALEALGWLAWSERRSSAGTYRDRYRDFAWERAPLPGGARVDGDFAYYETMSKWERSGAFDAEVATAGLQPESDVSTYNGTIWARAVGLYLPGGPGTPSSDPAYARALAYYEQRAYASTFLWDWAGASSERAEFAGLIRASDVRYRQATNVVGAIIANHLVSAVDAFVGGAGSAAPVELRVVPGLGAPGARWHLVFGLDPTR